MIECVRCWLYYFKAVCIQKALAEHTEVKEYYCCVESKYILSCRINTGFMYLACTDTGPLSELYILNMYFRLGVLILAAIADALY